MTKLSRTAMQILDADRIDPSGDHGSKIYDRLVKAHGKLQADEMWDRALNELDEYNGVERAES